MVSEVELEQQIRALGTQIFDEARTAAPAIWQADFYTGKLIEYAMDDDELRTALFRFVDVLPALRDAADVVRHVQEYFQPLAGRIPGLAKWGLQLDPQSLAAKAIAALVKSEVRTLAHRFIVGETATTSLPALLAIRKRGCAFTVDLLGEAVLSEREADEYCARYRELIRTLAAAVPQWPESRPLVAGHPGEATPLNISVKLSALHSQTSGVNTTRAVAVLAERLAALVRAARQCGCFVYVDMEDTQLTAITLATCQRVFGSAEFRDYDRVGLVLQAYLRRTERDLRDTLAWVNHRGAPLGIRLVKGAYWDTETIHARLANWPMPVWQQKAESDLAFENLTRLLLDNPALVRPAFGSHNIRSLCHAIAYAAAVGVDPAAYELQMLHGMADSIKAPFLRRGYLVREYAPIGELIPGMGYLVRRLLENTSNQGFIRRGFREGETTARLLAKPVRDNASDSPAALGAFQNCPLLDFSLAENRALVQRALAERAAAVEIGPMIAGDEQAGGHAVDSVSPEDKKIVAHVRLATGEQTDAALQALRDYFPRWRDTAVHERAEILVKTAAILERRRAELAAVMIVETGKPWSEADADVAEAIDYLRYYAGQARALFPPRRLGELAGEENAYFYEPRGVAAVIGPWNFPLAIPCGMLSAALVTGNCAVLKPSTQSPLIAWHLFRTLMQAGLPAGAAAFLPASGGEVGRRLAESPHVATLAFTGSKDVGLQLLNAAAPVAPGQEHVKRVIAEMGSKNAIIIDDDADLDLAVKGVIQSAFGYAGQKCSACSRVIVLAGVSDRFTARLAAAVESLLVGPATDPATFVGPVIDERAQRRLLDAIAEAQQSCRLVAQAKLPADHERGWYVPPTVFADVPRGHRLLQQELFGPLLALVTVPDFDAALASALDTEYGLTGGVYSRSPRHLDQAVREFRVGNLYLNRPCTGALVARQPFGGARLSGVGSKAGGPDYLLQFVLPRAVCESTLRRGFAPQRGG